MDITLTAKPREIIGKQVRGLRREGWVPGIVYGRDIESTAVQMAVDEITDIYQQAGSSTMIGVKIEGHRKTYPAFIREVQRDLFTYDLLHVDLEVVDLQRPINANVPIVLVGEAPVVENNDGVLTQSLEEVEVHCLPTDVPSHLDVDISQLTSVDQSIFAGDLIVSEKVEIVTPAEAVIVYITPLRPPEEEEEALEEEEYPTFVEMEADLEEEE
jgi:large subunit ribosomal protein L25